MTLKMEMENIKVIKDKKGFGVELIAFVIIGFVAVAIFAMFIYGFGQLNTILTSGSMDTSSVNLTDAASKTFSHVNTGIGGLRLISAIMLIGYALATLIFAYFSSKHQIWVFVYILMTAMIIIFSVYIANAFDDLKTNSFIGSTISSFGISGFILSHLPTWTTIIGLFGVVLCIVGAYARRSISE